MQLDCKVMPKFSSGSYNFKMDFYSYDNEEV